MNILQLKTFDIDPIDALFMPLRKINQFIRYPFIGI